MRVRHIGIRNLFGIFDHDIPLNTEDRITIIYGPNGYGKTYTLRLVNALLNPADTDFSEFFKIPFSELRVDFDNGSFLGVVKQEKAIQISANVLGHEETFYIQNELLAKTLEEFEDDYLKAKAEALVYLDELAAQKKIKKGFRAKLDFPDWFNNLRDKVDIQLIPTDRLTSYSKAEQSVVHAVNSYSRELGGSIEHTLARYAELSQSLDRTFPMRLIREGNGDLPLGALKKRLRALEEKRSRLTAVGLLDQEAVDLDALEDASEANRAVLSVYLADAEKKLAVFDDLVGKIELLVSIVNGRFLQKKLGIDRRTGFTFTAADGRQLAPENLSSGEQHVVVLMYELLFKVRPDTLILIDEPELSLHVYWQQQFLRDLADIIGLAHFDALIATHSPQIIHDRWDLAVELKGPAA